jgi:hypothetical protein
MIIAEVTGRPPERKRKTLTEKEDGGRERHRVIRWGMACAGGVGANPPARSIIVIG